MKSSSNMETIGRIIDRMKDGLHELGGRGSTCQVHLTADFGKEGEVMTDYNFGFLVTLPKTEASDTEVLAEYAGGPAEAFEKVKKTVCDARLRRAQIAEENCPLCGSDLKADGKCPNPAKDNT